MRSTSTSAAGGRCETKERLPLLVRAGPTARPSPLPPQANCEIGNDHHDDDPERNPPQMPHYVHRHSISHHRQPPRTTSLGEVGCLSGRDPQVGVVGGWVISLRMVSRARPTAMSCSGSTIAQRFDGVYLYFGGEPPNARRGVRATA